MCTSLSMYNGIFGRNLDLEEPFGQQIVITPRRYPISFRQLPTMNQHHAMIGTATVVHSYPLYAEAMNEYGLYMAGLNFPGNADYVQKPVADLPSLSPFEFIPWILGQCTSITQAHALLQHFNVLNEPFLPQLPLAPLHWHIADATNALVMEITSTGIHLYEDPIGVLTNNPPFPFHQMNLRQYRHLSPKPTADNFSNSSLLPSFCEGMGAIGLPGDASSPSRYVKASFLKCNAPEETNEIEQIIQFFHILDAVSMVKGSVITESGEYDQTLYSCAISKNSKTYYYKTYRNNTIRYLSMDAFDLEQETLFVITMDDEPQFLQIQ